AEDGIRDRNVTGVQTCALPIYALEEKVDVYVVTPEAGRVLRERVPATRHVFGGAAQAYAPVRGGRPVVSGPLRVAFGAADVDRRSEERRVGEGRGGGGGTVA